MSKFLATVAPILKAHAKAIAAFLTPIILAQLARLVPSIHIEPSMVAQLITGAISALSVYAIPNTPKP